MKTFELEGDFIPLIQLLKATGMVGSGGEAQQVVLAEMVRVNGEIETRKRCKILRGDVIKFENLAIKVI